MSGAGWYFFFYGEFIGEAVGYLVRHIDLLREPVRGVRQRYPFHIYAWVVLPARCGFFHALVADQERLRQALAASERRSTVRVTRPESRLALPGALRMQRAIRQPPILAAALQRDVSKSVPDGFVARRFGNMPSGMNRIMRGTWITFTTTR